MTEIIITDPGDEQPGSSIKKKLMGRMKEIFMQMHQKEIYEMTFGIPQAPVSIDIACPSCDAPKLMFNATTDIKCYHCNTTYILVDATTVELKCKEE
tara:strand:- start:1046 stop:1336 length:291 start_codon:yes stop_codon:yes gene_type:complete